MQGHATQVLFSAATRHTSLTLPPVPLFWRSLASTPNLSPVTSVLNVAPSPPLALEVALDGKPFWIFLVLLLIIIM